MKSDLRCIALVLLVTVRTIAPAFSESSINEQPLYGGIKKSPKQIELDQQFVDEAVKAAGTRQKALDQIIDTGWNAIAKAHYLTKRSSVDQEESSLQPDESDPLQT